MNSSTFDNLINSVKKASFSDNQVDIIKTTIQSVEIISTWQVVQLMKLLSFDNAKLEVAKMAYPYTYDQGSYASIVGDALTFSGAKSELNEYIRSRCW
ncbi:unnamed protein product [Rotaria sp. Silwood2]|nr:unnamed protein product [Rotaria sp. Silwood2]CAF3332166.1 unnamed protein product [Rotaria sp. Silwood2]CAF4227583.1 unnamed protein product [Rotaria sp. Silwood2]CAF4232427.1 unnamed protein product [Rotaria sp. Silwood2]